MKHVLLGIGHIVTCMQTLNLTCVWTSSTYYVPSHSHLKDYQILSKTVERQGQEIGSVEHFQTSHRHAGIDVGQSQICSQLGIELTSGDTVI